MEIPNFTKQVPAIILILLVPLSALAQEGFRGSKWGTDRAKVFKQQGDPIKQAEIKGMPSAVYEVKTTGREALAIFHFLPDSLKLAAGEYAFAVSHENPTGYVEEFNDVGGAISDLYGSPVHDRAKWSSDRFKNEYDDRGSAIEDGRLDLIQRWKTSEGIIIHKLSSVKPGGHTLLYIGMKYAPSFLAIQATQKYEGL